MSLNDYAVQRNKHLHHARPLVGLLNNKARKKMAVKTLIVLIWILNPEKWRSVSLAR